MRCRNVCFCVTVMRCVHWPQDGMNLSALQPRVSVCRCDRVRELFQHPLVSRCCCQHALTACYPPCTFSQCTPHTHVHTRRQWEGCGPREPWLPHNYYPPSLKLLPLWERGREREGWGAEDESLTIALLHPLCASLRVHLTRVSPYLWSLLEHVKHARRQSIPL